MPSELFSMVSPLIRHPSGSGPFPFDLVLVDQSGKWCSRCLLSERCRGCVRISQPEVTPSSMETEGGSAAAAAEEAEVLLQAGDNLAVSFWTEQLGGEEGKKALEKVDISSVRYFKAFMWKLVFFSICSPTFPRATHPWTRSVSPSA